MAALAAAAMTMVPVAAQQTPGAETARVPDTVPLLGTADQVPAPLPGGPELGAGFVLEGERVSLGRVVLKWR
ncbi:hypothetical protein [Candidatus Poriferisodalis sp.]|uniref:hypothetical protein n=1 Tax=Candidatus Poriferisodalis sp. TaxID=3101277 RepID=UPI003B01D504